MFFTVLDKFRNRPQGDNSNKVFLTWDDWNDYSFLTVFGIFYIDSTSSILELGNIKIGCYGQKEWERTLNIGDSFNTIDPRFFSVGLGDNYYQKLNELGSDLRDKVLNGLNDIAKNKDVFEKAIHENVTKVSLLRGLSVTTITGQFRRLAMGGVRLTSYHFKYTLPSDFEEVSPMNLSFDVEPESNPPSNIHVIIGRNGVGKTYLINNMINTLTKEKDVFGKFEIKENDESTSFANLVCVTFSAFDEFEHPPEKRDKSKGIQYSYIGLKSVENEGKLTQIKNPTLLKDEFVKSIFFCKNNSSSERWKKAISTLESDPLFKEANMPLLIDIDDPEKLKEVSSNLFQNLSTGHKIVLLTITRLVETIQERSLVLIDEPECHLHPPLLSSFTRALSELLIDRNGACVMATHSPVILQEVPKSCVWKLRRDSQITIAERLQIESFGENVGILTQEVFGLELTDSGFHNILKKLTETCASYEEAIQVLDNQIGLEAKAILRSLYYQKSKLNENNF